MQLHPHRKNEMRLRPHLPSESKTSPSQLSLMMTTTPPTFPHGCVGQAMASPCRKTNTARTSLCPNSNRQSVICSREKGLSRYVHSTQTVSISSSRVTVNFKGLSLNGWFSFFAIPRHRLTIFGSVSRPNPSKVSSYYYPHLFLRFPGTVTCYRKKKEPAREAASGRRLLSAQGRRPRTRIITPQTL